MIKMVRLDERLIHGQVAIKWSRLLGVDRIIVADDEAASNDIMQKALMMAAPNGVKVAIVSVDHAVALCNDPRAAALKILVIVSSPQSLLRVVREVSSVQEVNIGNYGRIAPAHDGLERRAYDKNLFADESEVACLREVIDTGLPCVVRTIPDDSPQDLARVLG